MTNLKLEEYLQVNPVKCVMLSPERKLSDVNVGQGLIIVFSEFFSSVCLRVE